MDVFTALGWFLRDFVYDPELLSRDQVDEKALKNLRGVVRTTHRLHRFEQVFTPLSLAEQVNPIQDFGFSHCTGSEFGCYFWIQATT